MEIKRRENQDGQGQGRLKEIQKNNDDFNNKMKLLQQVNEELNEKINNYLFEKEQLLL